jgi:hypothetical protein
MSPLGVPVLIVILAVVLVGSRRMAALGFMAGAIFLTQGMAIDVAGINFFAFRFVGLAAFLRVMLRGEYRPIPIPSIDKLFLALSVFTALVFVIRSEVDHAYHIGRSVDAILGYFACRGFLKSFEDVRALLRGTALLLVPYALLILTESVTHRNPFALIGGVDSSGWEREGRLRCMGSFRHPSLLGGIGAWFLALFGGLWFNRGDRTRAAIGILCSLAIIWGSNSGGPVSSAAVAAAGWSLWFFRTRLRQIQLGLLVMFGAAAALMNAPIWYLPTRVSGIVGGSGWHRSYLIDQAIKDIDQWWFAGMPITGTADWFPYVIKATGGADITNQFLVFGLTAGLGATLMFTVLIAAAFRRVGKALAGLFSQLPRSTSHEGLIWGLGVAIVVHLANWFGISYFDQSYSLWLLHLAAIVAIGASDPFYGYTVEPVYLGHEDESHVADERDEGLPDSAPQAGNQRA